jgi:sRNA-binding regulator protein Hfq
MSGKAGEQTVAANQEQKHALGKSANATANKFLASLRGTKVAVFLNGHPIAEGTLLEFDLYSMVIKSFRRNRDQLIFKGPGVLVEPVHPTDQLIVVGTPMHEMDLYCVEWLLT